MKLLVIGHAQHGKDTVCEILRDDFGLTFESSSKLLAEVAVRPWLAAKGITYPDFDTMYADRINHRAAWYDACAAYNEDDPAKFGKELFAKYDIYCGCRNQREVLGMRGQSVYDYCWWVDAALRKPPEDKSSNTLSPYLADFIINNNGSLENLRAEVHAVARLIGIGGEARCMKTRNR